MATFPALRTLEIITQHNFIEDHQNLQLACDNGCTKVERLGECSPPPSFTISINNNINAS